MFVKMRFVKQRAVRPTRGKNVRAVEEEGGGDKFKREKKKKGKFLEEAEDDVSVEDEAKILKPCVYKLR